MAAFQPDGADLVRQRRALADELVADPAQGLYVEMRLGLEGHEPHGRARSPRMKPSNAVRSEACGRPPVSFSNSGGRRGLKTADSSLGTRASMPSQSAQPGFSHVLRCRQPDVPEKPALSAPARGRRLHDGL